MTLAKVRRDPRLAGWRCCVVRWDRRARQPARPTTNALLRGALDGDDRQMPAPPEVADDEVEPNSRLTADESLGRSAGGASRPPRSRLESRRPACWTPMVVDLIRSRGSESGVRPVAGVPGEVKP